MPAARDRTLHPAQSAHSGRHQRCSIHPRPSAGERKGSPGPVPAGQVGPEGCVLVGGDRPGDPAGFRMDGAACPDGSGLAAGLGVAGRPLCSD